MSELFVCSFDFSVDFVDIRCGEYFLDLFAVFVEFFFRLMAAFFLTKWLASFIFAFIFCSLILMNFSLTLVVVFVFVMASVTSRVGTGCWSRCILSVTSFPFHMIGIWTTFIAYMCGLLPNLNSDIFASWFISTIFFSGLSKFFVSLLNWSILMIDFEAPVSIMISIGSSSIVLLFFAFFVFGTQKVCSEVDVSSSYDITCPVMSSLCFLFCCWICCLGHSYA